MMFINKHVISFQKGNLHSRNCSQQLYTYFHNPLLNQI